MVRAFDLSPGFLQVPGEIGTQVASNRFGRRAGRGGEVAPGSLRERSARQGRAFSEPSLFLWIWGVCGIAEPIVSGCRRFDVIRRRLASIYPAASGKFPIGSEVEFIGGSEVEFICRGRPIRTG